MGPTMAPVATHIPSIPDHAHKASRRTAPPHFHYTHTKTGASPKGWTQPRTTTHGRTPGQESPVLPKNFYNFLLHHHRPRFRRSIHTAVLPPTHSGPSGLPLQQADPNHRARAHTLPTIQHTMQKPPHDQWSPLHPQPTLHKPSPRHPSAPLLGR